MAGTHAHHEALLAFSRLEGDDRRVDGLVQELMVEIANTGCVRYPWHEVRPAMVALVRTRLAAFARAASSSEAEASAAEDAALSLADALASFDEAPFTVQRLCELLLAPTAYYARPDKLTRAVEKLLNVTGMVPSPTAPPEGTPGPAEETAPSSPARRAAKDPTHVQQTAFVSSLVGVAADRKTTREDDTQRNAFGGVGEDAAGGVGDRAPTPPTPPSPGMELARDAGVAADVVAAEA